jgi:predicted AlkP superfamily phosphohydrolase/phosphomutase
MARELRLVVLGLDGASPDIVRALAAQGRLPNLSRLMREGVWGSLRSTLPPVTAAAWSTFMTGLNPAGHGIFQWRTYDPTKYTNLDERVVTAARLAGRTFWDVLGRAGYRVAVITVPVTYPPWPVNGYMLSGYPCPDAERNYTYPQEWATSLRLSCNFSADHYVSASDGQILADGLDMLRRRTDLALALAEQGEIDACVLVLGEIDRAQHDFFKYADPRFAVFESAPADLREAINTHYEVADEQVGRLLSTLSSDGVMVIVSDHGGAAHPPCYFHTNAWLRSEGWLAVRAGGGPSASSAVRRGLEAIRKRLPFEEALRRRLPAGLVERARAYASLNIADVDWNKTCAYRFPMYYPAEGIELNVRGRQPRGIVARGAEYERTARDIIEALGAARDPETCEPIISEVYFKEEVYRGPYLDIAPDVVFVCHPTHRTAAEVHGDFTAPVDLDGLRKDNGVHTMNGIFFATGSGIAQGVGIEGAGLVDVAPTVLALAGLPVPEEMDGKVLQGVFTREPELRTAEAGAQPATVAPLGEITAEDEEDMLRKLRGLGYVE